MDDLYIYNDLVCMNNKIVIPTSLRKEILQRIHVNHMGIEKSKLKAREIFYWPGMSSKIEEMVSKCEICLLLKRIIQNR